jgi:predicted nucleic acid-binding protein
VSRPEANVPRLRRVYVDTSAYLCVLVGDEGAARLSEEMSDAELLSSALLVLEAQRNLVRFAREGTLDARQYRICADRLVQDAERLFVLRDLTLDLCESPVMPAVSTPRSLDLAHLRTALWFHTAEPIDRFLTLDAGQAQAATELGLPV